MFADDIHMDSSELPGQERFQRALSHLSISREDRVGHLLVTLHSEEIEIETRHCGNQFSPVLRLVSGKYRL